MLVLSRKKNETIHVGDDVVLKVVEVRGDLVRLGFEAPSEISILRGEVFQRIKVEGELRKGGATA